MKFCTPLIAVKDVEVSKKFYGELFGQKVAMDHGLNVVMDGGFSLQQDYAWLTGLPADSILEKPHNMELYFETDDFDGFLETSTSSRWANPWYIWRRSFWRRAIPRSRLRK